MDLALTARRVPAAEAQALRLVGGPLYDTPQQLAAGVVAAAKQLAAKPALAVRGTKRILLHTRWVLHRVQGACAL
jgi:enoyl-CoA hydratase/carnithine racemase